MSIGHAIVSFGIAAYIAFVGRLWAKGSPPEPDRSTALADGVLVTVVLVLIHAATLLVVRRWLSKVNQAVGMTISAALGVLSMLATYATPESMRMSMAIVIVIAFMVIATAGAYKFAASR